MNLHELTRTYGLRLLDLGVPNLAFPKITGLILGQVGSWVWSYCESKCAWWNEVYWNLWASSIPWTYMDFTVVALESSWPSLPAVHGVINRINLHQRSVLFTALLGNLNRWPSWKAKTPKTGSTCLWAAKMGLQPLGQGPRHPRHFDISGRPKAEGFPGWCE